MFYGLTTSGTEQEIDVYAELLPFEVREVDVNYGGNSGEVTVYVRGSKFAPNMSLSLETPSKTILAHQVTYIDPITVLVKFDLTGAPVGWYDVKASKLTGEMATLAQGFEVQQGTGDVLYVNLDYPAAVRPGTIAKITLQFANGGNNDIPISRKSIVSLFGAPMAFDIATIDPGSEDLVLELAEINGPPGILRPGAVGEVNVYSKALIRMVYSIVDIP